MYFASIGRLACRVQPPTIGQDSCQPSKASHEIWLSAMQVIVAKQLTMCRHACFPRRPTTPGCGRNHSSY